MTALDRAQGAAWGRPDRGDPLLWRALVRDAPIGIFQLDAALRFVTVNLALAALNGVPAEVHVGHTMAEVVPDLAPGLEPLARRVILGEAVSGVEVTGETAAAPGTQRCWLVSYYPLRPDGREVVGVAGVVMEITERKRAARRSSRLLDVAVALGRALRVTDVADVVTQACAAEVRTMTAGIVLYDEVRDSLRFVTMVGYPPSVVDGWREFPTDADIAITQALRTGTPVYEPRVRDYLRRHPEVAADTLAAGVGATASLPLVVAGRRVGVLALA
ncbi:MAG TPA: PAS domain-containing protein [Mycobacteriales bacterium]|nr:PAS domain-containing protein [Mycobacteriales bacterium]